MRFKFFILTSLLGINFTFGESSKVVNMEYTGTKDDINKMELALKSGYEVCITKTKEPIKIKIENCEISKMDDSTNEEYFNQIKDDLNSLPDKICNDYSCNSFFSIPFCMFKLFNDLVCSLPISQIFPLPEFLCDDINAECKILNNGCSFSFENSLESDSPFVIVGKLDSNLDCYGINFDFSMVSQEGLFILDTNRFTGKQSITFNIIGNNKLYFYWYNENNWSGSGNININFTNLAGFYLFNKRITGSINFSFKGTSLKNFMFLTDKNISGSGLINFNLDTSIYFALFDIPKITGSTQVKLRLKKAQKVLINISKLTGTSQFCIKIDSCAGNNILLWLEY